MSEAKLLNDTGLAHFWKRIKEGYWKGTQAEFEAYIADNSNPELRPGTIVHITDDYEEVSGYVSNVQIDESGRLVFTLSNGETITQGSIGSYVHGTLFEGTINYGTDTSNIYNSKVDYAVDGATVTIYFDIETNYGKDHFAFDNQIPAAYRPYTEINSLVAGSNHQLNNINIQPDGTVSCSSWDGNYNIKTAVTYVIVSDNSGEADDPGEIDEEEEQSSGE